MFRVGVARMAIGVVVTLGVLTLASGTAAAHAELLSSNPAADAILPVAPTEILLTFSEGVNTVPDSIRLVSSEGVDVNLGRIRQDEGEGTLAVDLPALANGTYVVAWRALSVDSHPISGAFTFSVGERTTTDPGLVASLLAGTKPSDGSERWLGVGRGASYLGITSLIGVAAMLSLLAPQLLLGRRAGRVLLGCAAVGAVGTLVMIAAQASITVGDWTAWREVYQSSAGRWWFIRLAFVVVAVGPIAVRRRIAVVRWWPTAMAIFSGCLLAVVAEGGHGATGRYITAGLVATVVHLAALSMWFGGLTAIALVAPRGRVVSLATEFSPIALWSVVVLAISGLFNSWRQVGSWQRLTDSDYGTWLIIKVTILGAVLAVAATSRWLVAHPPPATTDDAARPALGRTVLAEVVGIVLVFAATAGLVNSAPPRAAAQPSVASATVVDGDRLAQITLDPPVTGGTAMHVYLSSSTGSLDQPTDITVTASLTSQDIGPLTIPTSVAGPGHVTSTDADLPIAGAWTFTITAKYSEFDQVAFVAELTVR